MGAGRPQAIHDEHGTGPYHLVPHPRIRPRPQLSGMVQMQAAEQALLQGMEQIENPKAKGELDADEVGEAEHQEVDVEAQDHNLPQQRQPRLQHGRGHGGEVVMQGF